MELDFSFLEKIEPFTNDSKEIIIAKSINDEIEKLTKEIDSIDINSVPFDKWDLIMVFAIGLLEVGSDFLLGNPQKGLSNQLSDKNTKLGEYFNSLHEEIDHKGQPLDFQGRFKLDGNSTISFGGGDHRGRTFGHDLLMFPMAIYMLCKGKFIDGGYVDGAFNIVTSEANQYGDLYVGMSIDKAIIAYIIHMFADFCSTKSLQVPGFGIISHFPNRDIRKLVNNMYSNGFNFRHMFVQGIPVLATEILIRIYIGIRYWKSKKYSKNAIIHKRNKLLLITHSFALTVNIGKVIITKNPTLINLPMIIRVLSLIWKVIKEEIRISQIVIEKINLSLLKNKYETLETMILLDQAIYYTKEIDKIIVTNMIEFDNFLERNKKNDLHGEKDFTNLLNQFKKINS